MIPDAAIAPGLAEVLRDAGYDAAGLEGLWGHAASAALERHDPTPASLAARRSHEPLATLASLFRLGEPVATDEAAATGLDTSALVAARVLEHHEGGLRATFTVAPVPRPGLPDLLILADHDATTRPGPLPDDHVLGVGGASRTLAAITVRERVGDLLDLGTGCGIQALLAAPFAERIVATDISERALAIAAFNCALNGARNVDLRHGSLFEPVAGERFDQIVSNPPFVITPRDARVPTYEYRDAGRAGDALVAEVFAGAGEHLRPGGRAQFLANWEYRGGDAEPVRGWIAPGTRAWVVERQVSDPAEYAETWVRDSGLTPADAGYRPMLEAWLEDFDARGVERIGFGWVMLQVPGDGDGPAGPGEPNDPTAPADATDDQTDPPTDAPLLFERVDSGPGDNPGGLGAHLRLSAEVAGWLTVLSDADVAALRFTRAADVREERVGVPGEPHPELIVLRQGGGLARSAGVDTATAAFVGACDGELTLGQIAAALAELLGVDQAGLEAQLCAQARELARTGFLHPLVDEDGAHMNDGPPV